MVANSANADPANSNPTKANSSTKQSSPKKTATGSSSRASVGTAQKSKSSTPPSEVESDDESHLHGWIPTGKRDFNAVEELTMDDPVIEDPDDEPIVLQEQKAKIAVPDGVLQKGFRVDALPHYNLANKYLNQGRFQDAARKYRDAITVYDKEADFYINLGVALRKLNDYVGAEEAFKQALALNSADWMAWSNLANAYLKQEKLADTVESFKQCLKRNPPAQERVAIEQDIKDITKILRMRDPNFDAKPSVASKVPGASKQLKGSSVQSKPTPKAQSASAVSQPTSKPTSITPVSPEKLQGSGWDYMYK